MLVMYAPKNVQLRYFYAKKPPYAALCTLKNSPIMSKELRAIMDASVPGYQYLQQVSTPLQ